MKRLVAPLLVAVLGGCALDEAGDGASQEDAIHTEKQDGPASAFPESVQVWMPNGVDFCTGVLVSGTRVVTAAHCLLADRSWTEWTVEAPFAAGKPSRKARMVGTLTNDPNDPAQGDVGVLELDRPIAIAEYAALTDVGARADGGERFQAVAVGRAKVEREAPLVRSKPLAVRSAKTDGYPTGLATPYYSGGGDSGGGLFLVENGAVTHKVIGFERNPSPERGVDYFTRVDGALRSLVGKARGATPSIPAGGPSVPVPAPSSTSR